MFPVNTEFQRVRGEGFSDGYAQEHAAGIQKAGLSLKMHPSSTHTHQAISALLAEHKPTAFSSLWGFFLQGNFFFVFKF